MDCLHREGQCSGVSVCVCVCVWFLPVYCVYNRTENELKYKWNVREETGLFRVFFEQFRFSSQTELKWIKEQSFTVNDSAEKQNGVSNKSPRGGQTDTCKILIQSSDEMRFLRQLLLSTHSWAHAFKKYSFLVFDKEILPQLN